MPKSVYLAGPEVFLPNAREILDLKIALTREAGLIPVSPGDLEFPRTDSKWELGLAISAIDEKLMHGAHAIIANLTPFRGLAADTGTCFELGFMCAQGKPAFAYTSARPGGMESSRRKGLAPDQYVGACPCRQTASHFGGTCSNVRADHGERTRAHFNGEWYADAEGKPRGPDHILIEDLGFIDNLMLHGGVVRRGDVDEQENPLG